MNRRERNPQTVLAETPYLRLIQQGHWTFAQRPNTTGAIAIIAVTDDRQIVLVEQYRIPVANRVIELPAGLVGDEPEFQGETLEDAAQRELLEETGFDAGQIRVVTVGVSSAGLTDERVHLLMATELTRAGPGGGNHHENIRVHTVSLSDVSSWLWQQQRAGKDVDFKVFAGLLLADREHE